MLPARKENIRKHKGRRCKAIILLMASFIFLFVNTPLSFAGFASDGKATFSASVTVASFVDSDYDGIPDEYDLNPNDYEDAVADDDNDGLTNLEEYRNGSDPIVSESGIEVSIIADPAGGNQSLDVALEADVVDNGGYPIVKYEWDFDGSGTYDYSSREPSVEYKFTVAGENNVKLRVTNEIGGVGVAAETIEVIKTTTLPDITTLPTGIEAPVPYTWTFLSTKSDDIAVYRWDLIGNGEHDFTSNKSGSITHTYRDVKRRSFNAHFKATDTEGLSDAGVTAVDIKSLSWYNTDDWVYRPKVIFNSDYVIKHREAGEEISLSGYGTPAAGNDYGYATKLEWDFESDGVYDWVTAIYNNKWTGNADGNADVTHIYGTPGIYRATLKVTTEANLVATDHILVIVEDSGMNPPTAKAQAEYYIDGGEETYDPNHPQAAAFLEGTVPFKVTFVHKTSSGNIDKFEWDFDGDKRFDYITTEYNPQENKPVHTYTKPGYCLACLRVTDKEGLTDTAYIPVFVSMPDTYASIITTPEENQTIAGNAVTLTCDVFPDDAGVETVMFQYSADSGATWNNIGLGQEIGSYMTTWNTRLVDNKGYLIRAIVNGAESDAFHPTPAVVDNLYWGDVDIHECKGLRYTKNTRINPNKHNEIILANGARIVIPAGAIESDWDKPIVDMAETDESAGVGNAISLYIEGAPNCFTKDITIIMPYPDSNDDGIVDGTGRDENEIVIMWKNEEGVWEPLYDSVVYPDENFVVAKVNHFTLFGAGFFSGGAAAIFGGGSAIGAAAASYCFVATAAYDSADAEDVIILKEFRDRFLLTNPLGQRFVNCYYKYSPPIAEYIKNKPVLKKMTRLMLRPIAKFAKWRLYEVGPRTMEK